MSSFYTSPKWQFLGVAAGSSRSSSVAFATLEKNGGENRRNISSGTNHHHVADQWSLFYTDCLNSYVLRTQLGPFFKVRRLYEQSYWELSLTHFLKVRRLSEQWTVMCCELDVSTVMCWELSLAYFSRSEDCLNSHVLGTQLDPFFKVRRLSEQSCVENSTWSVFQG